MKNNKPSFIKVAKGGKVSGLEMRGNKMFGDADFINNEGELEDVTLAENQHILSSQTSNKKWYEKPLGILTLIVIGGLVIAFLSFKFGWNT